VSLARWIVSRPVINPVVRGAWRLSGGRSAAGALFGQRHFRHRGLARARLPNGKMLRLVSRSDDNTANRIYWRGWSGHEAETSRLFYALASRSRGTVDVGAHVGYFSIIAAHANPEGRVFAFEPIAANAARMRQNLALSGVADVEVHEAALAERRGPVVFRAPRDGAMGVRGALAETGVDPSRPDEAWETIQVPGMTLDGFLTDRGQPPVDLVKIDVEGPVVRVLRGMGETLHRTAPVLVVEILTDAAGEAVRALTDPLGYEVHRLTGEGPVAVTGPILREAAWRNYLLVSPHSALRSVVEEALP
jgi:FkbM family methyltransferase